MRVEFSVPANLFVVLAFCLAAGAALLRVARVAMLIIIIVGNRARVK